MLSLLLLSISTFVLLNGVNAESSCSFRHTLRVCVRDSTIVECDVLAELFDLTAFTRSNTHLSCHLEIDVIIVLVI